MEATQKSPLEPRSISQILDYQFFIPHYQRGYRWTKQQVEDLLNDIDAFVPKEVPGKPNVKTFYCLQPIVLKGCSEDTKSKHRLEGDWYEVIDGQQRLTTIYLINHYANERWTGDEKSNEPKIMYETREKSERVLNEIKINKEIDGVDIINDNIDFHYISSAYDTIHQWRKKYDKEKGEIFDKNGFQTKFNTFSKIIWYEVGDNENGKELFERLNMGKIPLTNAELIKALFLSSSSFAKLSKDEQMVKRLEISKLWDEIEQRLNERDERFWCFLTNKKRETFSTKIELLLDMIAGKKLAEKDPLSTFLYFSKKQKTEGLDRLWEKIEEYYLTFCEWYKDKEFYHKVGYLIAVNAKVTNAELVRKSTELGKKGFKQYLNSKIEETVKCEISELRYGEHDAQLQSVLLLFNIQTILNTDGATDYYPFNHHKAKRWSLEHIHAQNSEGVDNTEEAWGIWLKVHSELIEDILESGSKIINASASEKVLEEIRQFGTAKGKRGDLFKVLYDKVNDLFCDDSEGMRSDRDGIGNMALLSQPDNSALNNSVFEAKRRMIIDLDKSGRFIPICTRRAFMKYYIDKQASIHFHFWTKEDRKVYQDAIRTCLKDYLPSSKNISNENQ